MKVLIAIDESEYSKVVMEEVVREVWWPHTEFMVLNVIGLPTLDHWQEWGLAVEGEIRQRLRAEAEEIVHKNVKLLKDSLDGYASVEGSVVEGHVCDSIIKFAEEWDADLIMLGSHGRRGLGRFLLGSVAEEVLMRAPCAVQIVKAKKHAAKEGEEKKKTVVLY